MKYQPKGRPRGSSSDDGKGFSTEHFITSTTNTVNTGQLWLQPCDCIEVNGIPQPYGEWMHMVFSI
jgi:hypothetical protein